MGSYQTEPWKMDTAAADLWGRNNTGLGLYSKLTRDGFGIAEIICARSAPMVLRLALIYAILDEASTIRVEHINAAIAVWRYAENSVIHVFGDALGDSTADVIRDELRVSPEGLTRNEIRELFGRNKLKSEIDRALTFLKSIGKADFKLEPTDGRPTERWFSTE